MKTLRVRIGDALWEDLKPFLKHGEISRIFRHALRMFLYDEKVKSVSEKGVKK